MGLSRASGAGPLMPTEDRLGEDLDSTATPSALQDSQEALGLGNVGRRVLCWLIAEGMHKIPTPAGDKRGAPGARRGEYWRREPVKPPPCKVCTLEARMPVENALGD